MKLTVALRSINSPPFRELEVHCHVHNSPPPHAILNHYANASAETNGCIPVTLCSTAETIIYFLFLWILKILMARSYFELPQALRNVAAARNWSETTRPQPAGSGDCIVAGSFHIHSCRWICLVTRSTHKSRTSFMPTSEDRGRVVSILLHIWEVLGQNFSLRRGYSDWEFSWISPEVRTEAEHKDRE
jgi:hypothetical protein